MGLKFRDRSSEEKTNEAVPFDFTSLVLAGLLAAAGLSAQSDSGQFYLLLGETLVSVKDQVAGMAGKPAIVTGVIAERDGIKAIQMKKIELSK